MNSPSVGGSRMISSPVRATAPKTSCRLRAMAFMHRREVASGGCHENNLPSEGLDQPGPPDRLSHPIVVRASALVDCDEPRQNGPHRCRHGRQVHSRPIRQDHPPDARVADACRATFRSRIARDA